MKVLAFLLLFPPLAFAQTQHDRIKSRGQSTFEEISNIAAVVITGATPTVSAGNVFKTNNGGVVTVTNLLGGVDTQMVTIICGDANTTLQNNANIVNTAGADFICGINKTISYVYDAAQVKWIQSGTGTGGGGGGGSPGAPANCLQKNNGSGGFGCAAESSDGTNFVISENTRIKGPNPYIDVTAPPYNVRAVTTVPSTTCSISSGSTAATLAAASTFQNGDGLVCYGAGATNTMSTPSAPVVAPSLAAGSIRTDERVGSTAGATSYSYVIVGRNKNGALSAASASGTTSTGLATLGAIVVNITSATRANNVVTVTTSSAHQLTGGAAFYINGIADNTFSGPGLVTGVPDNTHFTFTQGYDTREGATTSTTGGNVTWYAHNHLSWTAVTGAFEYEIYGRIAGSLAFIGTSRPNEISFDDYGSTIMGVPFRPAYVSSTPPVSATNEPLVTTIVSGAGTTSLVLANAATNTVSGASAVFDDGVNLLAAVTAAGGATLYFPASAGAYVFNSYTNLIPVMGGASLNVWQAGQINLNETLELPNVTTWTGEMGGTGPAYNGFAWNGTRRIQVTAFPGFWFDGGAAVSRVKGIGFTGNNFDQELLVLEDGVSGFAQISFEYSTFATGSGASFDVMGIGYETRGASLNMFERDAFTSTLDNGGGTPVGLWAPLFYDRGDLPNFQPQGPHNAGSIFLRDTFWSSRGITVELTFSNSNVNGEMIMAYTQGNRTPWLVVEQSFGGSLGSQWKISNTTEDTTFAPIVANLSQSFNSLLLDTIGGGPSGFAPTVTGNPISNLTVLNSGANIPNTGVTAGSYFSNNNASVNGNGSFQYTLTSAIAAPSAAVSAGGSVANGTYPYAVQFIDINGNYSPLSSSAQTTTTTGNNTVTITRPAVPPGMVSWTAYRNGSQINCFSVPLATTSIVDSLSFTCGQQTRAATAGVSMISSAGVSSPTLTLINNGFTSTVSPSALSANRSLTPPDASGTICVTALCGVNAVTIGGDATLSSSPRTVPPVFFPGAMTTTWTGASWTLDRAITVTRIQSAARVPPSGCGTNAVIRLTDGSTPVNLTITGATNDSGVIAQNYSANATMTVGVQVAAGACTTSPGDANVMIQYRMQ